MPLTLTVPPAIARDAQTYATRRGTTMAALVLEYLAKMASAERQVHKSGNPVLKFCGTPIPTNDIWIAASALECGGVLLTNDHHFQHIPNLPTMVY